MIQQLSIFLTALSASVLLAQAPGTVPKPPQSSATGSAEHIQTEHSGMEQQILSKMHELNQMEIELGKLAQQKAADTKVKRYGDRLARDHGLGDRKVTSVAKQLGITLVKPEPANAEEKQKMQMKMELAEKLHSLSGSEFDKTFLQAMVQGHDDAINMLHGAEDHLPPQSPVRTLVKRMIPILQQHHDVAADLDKAGS